MSKEGLKPSDFYAPSALILLSIVSLFGFSQDTRQLIRVRDQVDVIDGSNERLEAAHIDHSRSNPRYDDKSNGRLLSAKNHYLDHVNRAGRNGLDYEQNQAAKRMIWARLTREEQLSLPNPD